MMQEKGNLALKFIMIIAAMFVGNLVFLGISALLTQIFWDFNLFSNINMLGNFNNPEIMPIIRLVQAMQTIGMFLVPGIAVSYLFKAKLNDQLLVKKSISIHTILLSIILIIVMMPVINWLASLNMQMKLPSGFEDLEYSLKMSETRATQLIEAILTTQSIQIFLINTLVVAVLPAIAEEVLFRGVFQNILTDNMKNPYVAILITAIVFSAVHLQFYTFLPRVALGVILGLVYFWSKNLLVPILFHFLNNFGSVVAWFMFSEDQINNIDSFGTSANMWMIAMVSVIATILILVVLQKRFAKSH